MPLVIERVLRYPRALLIFVLIVATGLSWTWIALMATDMYGSMSGPSAWMMAGVWDAPHVALLWAMWAVMMAAMMLPSAAPILLLSAGSARTRAGGSPAAALPVYAMAAGYLAVWAAFSAGATILQRVASERFLLTGMMEPATPLAAAAVLFLAGVYQLTPLKAACLRTCRSPLSFLTQHWRPGTAGGFRMGLEHGVYCLGCCWALMLLLFAGGVMNLLVIVALTVWVMAEKLAPYGEQGARVGGALLIAAAVWMLLR